MTTKIVTLAGVQHRFLAGAFTVEAGADGKFTASLSSETPIRTPWGAETLVHTPDAVNLARAVKGLPLLIDHDHTRQLGRVVNIRIENRRLVGDLVLSDREEVAGIRADVLSGLRPDLSIGYTIDQYEDGPGPDDYLVTRWTIVEVSSVLVPADHTVGVGRALCERNSEMTTPSTTAPNSTLAPVTDVTHERQRVLDIQEMGKRLSLPDELVDQAINEGWSRDRFAEHRFPRRAAAIPLRTAEGPVNNDDFDAAKQRFSLVATIKALADKRELTGLEREVSDELIRRNGGIAPRGVLVPVEVLSTRTQLVGTAGIGGNLVGTDFRPQDFVDPLRNASSVMTMGARILTDLIGNVAIPRQTTSATSAWLAEDAANSDSDLNFNQITMSPKTVGAGVSWSRQMALQGLPAMEQIVRADLTAQLGLALDLAALNGSGSGNQPRGILQTAGIGSVPIGANGGPPTYDHIVDLESVIAIDNAATGNLGYLTNTKVRGQLKKTEMFAGTNGNPVWQNSATPLNGYRAGVSNQVPSDLTKGTAENICSAIVFGNWSDLLIGMWGGLDLILDPYTHSERGRVRINAFMSADIAVRHVESFAAILDATTPGV